MGEKAYPYYPSVLDVLISALMLTHEFNGSFWVISPIFIGSSIIFLYRFLKYRLGDKLTLKLSAALMTLCYLTILFLLFDNIIFHTAFLFVGVLLRYRWESGLLKYFGKVSVVLIILIIFFWSLKYFGLLDVVGAIHGK